MDPRIAWELRILKGYAVVSALLFCVLLLSGAKSPDERPRFREIDVERINIVEKDGTLRLAISNRERSPGPILGGRYMKSSEGQRPGLIFFNDKGDECGGMTWGSREENGSVQANAGLMFDQYDQDQTVALVYSQSNDSRSAGLRVWDRPLVPIAGFAAKLEEIAGMEDGPEKTAAVARLRREAAESGIAGVARVFVGRGAQNEAVVSLADASGKPRILLTVDGNDVASLQFLDENGKVVHRIPSEGPAESDR